MKVLVLVLFMLTVGAVTQAQQIKRDDFFKPYGNGFVASTAGYWGGVAADLYTSTRPGRLETNPLLRRSDGRISMPKALAISAAVYAVTLPFEKKHPKLTATFRFIVGGLRLAQAVKNSRT